MMIIIIPEMSTYQFSQCFVVRLCFFILYHPIVFFSAHFDPIFWCTLHIYNDEWWITYLNTFCPLFAGMRDDLQTKNWKRKRDREKERTDSFPFQLACVEHRKISSFSELYFVTISLIFHIYYFTVGCNGQHSYEVDHCSNFYFSFQLKLSFIFSWPCLWTDQSLDLCKCNIGLAFAFWIVLRFVTECHWSH